MEPSGLIERVYELTDLELAVLLCLTARQHCIIEFERGSQDLLEQELQLIASNVFGLSNAVVHCDQNTTLEDFSDGILLDVTLDEDQENAGHGKSYASKTDATLPNVLNTEQPNDPHNAKSEKRIANFIIVTGLAEADKQIQIQTLELLRTRRIFTHTEIHTSPKSFVLVVLSAAGDVPLVEHLNDHIFISHYHAAPDGHSNLDEMLQTVDNDTRSIASDIHPSGIPSGSTHRPFGIFREQEIEILADLSHRVTITAETEAYLHNLVVFLRRNRAVAKGVSPIATTHFKLLSRILTAIHGQSFATPAIIGLAFHKVYRHRVKITTADMERSLQYGSHPKAIASMLNGVTVDTVLENVLQELEVPV